MGKTNKLKEEELCNRWLLAQITKDEQKAMKKLKSTKDAKELKQCIFDIGFNQKFIDDLIDLSKVSNEESDK